MFKRIVYENWTGFVPIAAFWLTFAVFVAISLRALLLRKKTVNRLSELPFQDERPAPPDHER